MSFMVRRAVETRLVSKISMRRHEARKLALWKGQGKVIDQLHVKNVALIRDVTIEPSAGLTVLTGETGAGKTALLSAIKLLVGERADAGSIREGSDSLEVEGRFYTDDSEDGEGTVVRRRVDAHGRGRVSIDGHMASVRELAQGVGTTVDLCGQHEHQQLLRPHTHTKLLDDWLGAAAHEALQRYQQAWQASAAAAKELKRIQEIARHADERVGEAQFVLGRIDEVGPSVEEWHELEETLPRAMHADTLLRAANSAHELLVSDEGILDAMGDAIAEIDSAAHYDANLEQHASTLRSALIDVEDVSRELRSYIDKLDVDPAALDAMQTRMAALQGLMRSYGPRIEDVLSRRKEAAEILAAARDGNHAEEKAAGTLAVAEKELSLAAKALDKVRFEGAPKLSRAITAELPGLAMGSASVEVKVNSLAREQWTSSGASTVELCYRPAEGLSARPLRRIASGGEISRVMLACKVALGAQDETSTLVFDEVDAGVGGATAVALASVLGRLAKTHQVIVVTHLAQVAVHAQRHYVVRKRTSSKEPSIPETVIDEISGDEQVDEIARMIAGDTDELSRAHAKKMIEGVSS